MSGYSKRHRRGTPTIMDAIDTSRGTNQHTCSTSPANRLSVVTPSRLPRSLLSIHIRDNPSTSPSLKQTLPHIHCLFSPSMRSRSRSPTSRSRTSNPISTAFSPMEHVLYLSALPRRKQKHSRTLGQSNNETS